MNDNDNENKSVCGKILTNPIMYHLPVVVVVVVVVVDVKRMEIVINGIDWVKSDCGSDCEDDRDHHSDVHAIGERKERKERENQNIN